MRYRRIILFISCFAFLLPAALPTMAQARFGNKKIKEQPASQTWTEEDALRILTRDSKWEQVNSEEHGLVIDYIYQDLTIAGKVAARLKSDRIVQAIIDFPVHDPDVGQAKIAVLHNFKDNVAAYECVVQALENPELKIQREAARVLFGWEEWDLSIPIIHKYGNYDALGVSKNNKDPRVIPILQEGAQTSSSWEGRILAAFYLQSFGDSLTIIEVSRDVVANAPIDMDDSSVARAKYTALRTLARCHITDNIPNITRLADDQSTLVRIQVVDILELYAYNGIEEAYQALQRIAEENDDLDLRGTAKVALENIESHRREK